MIHSTTSITINGKGLPIGVEDLESGAAVALSGVRVTWSRETSFLPPEPGSCTIQLLRLRSHEAVPVRIDDRIRITTVFAGSEPLIVFDGWVDEITEHAPRPGGGRQMITVAAIDAVGRQSRRRIGSKPWPVENMYERLKRFESFLPGFDAPVLGYTTDIAAHRAYALDADSRNPVELLQQHLTPFGYHVIATPDGIAGRPLAWVRAPLLIHRTAEARTELETVATIEMPTAAIDDVQQRWAYDARITALSTRWLVMPEGGSGRQNTTYREVSRTWGDRDASGLAITLDIHWRATVPGSSHTVTQEFLDDQDPAVLPFGASSIERLAERVVRPTAEVQPRLDPLCIRWKQLDASDTAGIAQLIGILTRWDNIVELVGARPGVPLLQTIIGGELVLAGTEGDSTLTLTCEPLSLNTDAPIIWADLATAITWTSLDPPITWADLALTSESRTDA